MLAARVAGRVVAHVGPLLGQLGRGDPHRVQVVKGVLAGRVAAVARLTHEAVDGLSGYIIVVNYVILIRFTCDFELARLTWGQKSDQDGDGDDHEGACACEGNEVAC